jgi:uncharacterized membrane protein YozB (DUF420 family)
MALARREKEWITLSIAVQTSPHETEKEVRMIFLLNGPGFLGSRAPLYADITLLLTLITAGMFTLGLFLAKRKQYEVHRWVQTAAACLNALVVLLVMIWSFVTYILPGIPGKLLTGTYGITTVHAFVGAIGLLFGLFVVLRANGLMPKPLRFKNYKLFMRIAYSLYMFATLIGVIVYLAVYVGPAA